MFKSAEQFSKGMRARACSVVLRTLKLAAVSLLDSEPTSDVDKECVQLLQHILPNFVEAFAQEISSPLTGNSEGEVLMRIEIVRIFFLVVELQPRLAQGSLPLIVHGLWQVLFFFLFPFLFGSGGVAAALSSGISPAHRAWTVAGSFLFSFSFPFW